MSAYLGLRAKEAIMADPKTPQAIEKQHADELLDEELDETFPASDPPSSLLREPHEPPKTA
jgi:hypothetical protein